MGTSRRWSEAPIFEEPIEAWANGPVSPALYELHKGDFTVKRLYDKKGNPVGDANALTDEERETVQVVLNDYGHQSGQWLSKLAHMENPWRDARRRCGRKPGDRCSEIITHNEMALYYGGLLQSDAAETEDSWA